MKIIDFVEKCKGVTDTQKKNILKEVAKETYIPSCTKQVFIENLVATTSFKKDEKSETLAIKFDSIMRDKLLKCHMVECYTSLEFEDVINEYDLLCKNDLLSDLLETIPENEFIEFMTYLELAMNDFYKNNCDVGVIISNYISKVVTSELKEVLEALVDEKVMNNGKNENKNGNKQ